MGEQSDKGSTDTSQRAILIFSSISIAGLATENKEEKYSSHVGSTLERDSSVNYKYWLAKFIGSPETANGGATRKCLT